jgi:serine/threonine protein kinase
MHHQFRHYDVIRMLEQHNDSLTYLVNTHEQPMRKAILKVFHKPALLSLAKREKFLQQVNMLTHIKHPYIVPIIDGGIEKGKGYVVSEYMVGGSLRARLDQAFPERLPFEEAMTIVSQIGQALTSLHEQTIVHGHLMPKHIFFDVLEQAFLSDIYIPDQVARTEQEPSFNSLRYLSPEQCQEAGRSRSSTELSDQYALCCIAYELLTGQTPFTATDPRELKEQQLHAQPVPLTIIASELPDTINKVILKGLQKDPQQRYPTITVLLTALQIASQITMVGAIPVITAEQTTRFIPPNTVHKSDADILAHFPSYDLPSLSLIRQSLQQTFVTYWHPFATIGQARQKRLWLGSAVLTIICCLIAYATFAFNGPQLSRTHGASHTQIPTLPTTIAIQPTQIQPTTVAATVIAIHQRPTATAHMNPTPTPTTAPQNPTATAITLLFSGQITTHTGKRNTFSLHLISQLIVNNVRIEADITNQGDGGGIAFRSNKNATAGYRFYIWTNGMYELKASKQIIARSYSSAINTGSNVSNHITIVAVGSSISIAVNAQNVVNVSNNDYSSGSVGLMAVDLRHSTVTTCNFTIYQG